MRYINVIDVCLRWVFGVIAITVLFFKDIDLEWIYIMLVFILMEIFKVSRDIRILNKKIEKEEL